MSTLIHLYIRLKRKFCREISDAKENTYQRFRQWISSRYPNGIQESDIQKIVEEDTQLGSSSAGAEQGDFTLETQSPSLSTPPTMSPISPLPPIPS